MERRLLWLIRLAIVLTLCVIVLGAYTRLTDAGLGCPDWPGCYGQLTVPQSESELLAASELYPAQPVDKSKAWAEMVHRYFAGSLGLLVFAITFMCLKSKFVGAPVPITLVPITLSLGLSVLVVAQALLGMWTVTLKLMPVIVLAHLFGGFALLSLLVLLHTRIEGLKVSFAVSKSIRRLALFTLVIVIGQIFLGGWTSSNYAALMCTSLPICQGDWMSSLDFKTAFALYQPGHDSYEFGVLDYAGRMTIHVSHRMGAIVTAISVCLLCWQLGKNSVLKNLSGVLFLLLVIQISLGISNVLFQLPLSVAVLHNLGGALLLICLIRINYQITLSRETGGSYE